MIHARKDYNRIQDPSGLIPENEPVFLIRAKDKVGAHTVRMWAVFAKSAGASKAIIGAALDQAEKMEAWPEHQIPDMPEGE